jgi:hypothetical protein
MGRGRAVADGCHGGDAPPLGYRWTERVDENGNIKHGRLEIDPELAPIVDEAFEARDQ